MDNRDFLEDVLSWSGINSTLTCLTCGELVSNSRLSCPHCEQWLIAPFCTLGNHFAQLHDLLDASDEELFQGWDRMVELSDRYMSYWEDRFSLQASLSSLQRVVVELLNLIDEGPQDDTREQLAYLFPRLTTAFVSTSRATEIRPIQTSGALLNVCDLEGAL